MNIIAVSGRIFKENLKRIKALLFSLLRIFILLMIILFFIQDKLVFFPRKITESYSKYLLEQYPNIEEIRFYTPDKVVLRGWYVKNNSSGKSPLIIYFGGSAEELSYLISEASQFDKFSVLLINYRGYGLSQGSPNEHNLFKDSELIFDKITKRTDIDRDRIIIMGRSIGTGIAVYLANIRKVKGVILITPYDSVVSVAQEKVKFLPVSLILINRFNSIAIAPKIKVSLLALIAKNDEFIPSWHAIKLVNKWGGPKIVRILDGVGHNTIEQNSLYWDSIKKFLKQTE